MRDVPLGDMRVSKFELAIGSMHCHESTGPRKQGVWLAIADDDGATNRVLH
jgi:hypothetical protein